MRSDLDVDRIEPPDDLQTISRQTRSTVALVDIVEFSRSRLSHGISLLALELTTDFISLSIVSNM